MAMYDLRRAIPLKTCFNINQRQDTKHKHVIALYTKDDSFGLVLGSEDELKDWLKALLSLQYGEGVTDGEEPKPTFGKVMLLCEHRVGPHSCALSYGNACFRARVASDFVEQRARQYAQHIGSPPVVPDRQKPVIGETKPRREDLHIRVLGKVSVP
jgi:hypothetical protein